MDVMTCFRDPQTAEDEEPHLESICVESRAKESDKEPGEEKEKEGEEKKEGTRSRSSSTSSEDYIIILPDCFDTSRPLGESMYRCGLPGKDLLSPTWLLTSVCVSVTLTPHSLSHRSSALSQPGDIPAKTPTDPETPSSDLGSTTLEGEPGDADETTAAAGLLANNSANDMLCTSQTLDDEPLTPEVVAPPKSVITPRSV